MPRQTGWKAKCSLGHKITCSYDPHKHLWARACRVCGEFPLDWEPRYARPRDSQRAKVYRAETEICHPAVLDDDWRSHVRQILKSGGVKTDIELRDGRGCRHARGGLYSITLPRWARTILTACHEVAHTATWSETLPAHGPTWAAVYYALVKLHCPKHESEALYEAFRREGVKVDYALALECIKKH